MIKENTDRDVFSTSWEMVNSEDVVVNPVGFVNVQMIAMSVKTFVLIKG